MKLQAMIVALLLSECLLMPRHPKLKGFRLRNVSMRQGTSPCETLFP